MIYGEGGTKKKVVGRKAGGNKKLVKKGPYPKPPAPRVDYKFPNEAARKCCLARYGRQA